MGGFKIVGRGLAAAIVFGGAGAAALFAGSGCQTLSSDFESLKEDIMPPSPGEAAQMMFDQYDAEKRRRGTALISNAPFGGAEVYLAAYVDFVENEQNPIVLATAIRALARHGDETHAILIAKHLSHPSQQVRWEAAKGLQRLHDPEVAPLLVAVLSNEAEDADVRVACADALGQYPQDRAFQALVQALGVRELAVNLAASKSLTTLTGQDHGDDPRAWLVWYGSTETPFAGQQEYLYPTYERDDTLLEKMAFWSKRTWETPQQPAGLRPRNEQSTYGDEGTSPAADDGAEG